MCRKIRYDRYCANFFGLHGQLNRPLGYQSEAVLTVVRKRERTCGTTFKSFLGKKLEEISMAEFPSTIN
jgi:hypothetical protein